MRSLEPRVRPDSEYFMHHPGTVASKIYFYPTSIGLFDYEAGYHLRRTSFDSFLLFYIERGSCLLMRQSTSVRVPSDSFVLLDCYQPHEYAYDQDSRVLWLHFDGPLARVYYDLIQSANTAGPGLHGTAAAVHILRRLYRSFKETASCSETEMSAMITEILSTLLDSPARPSTTQGHDHLVRQSLAYISEHFCEEISLETLASRAGMSLYHFTRVFAAETGFTPHQYLIATRLNSAKFLLRTTGNTSIKEIAYRSGFNSESSFCSTFRKWEHMTPGEYRVAAFTEQA